MLTQMWEELHEGYQTSCPRRGQERSAGFTYPQVLELLIEVLKPKPLIWVQL